MLQRHIPLGQNSNAYSANYDAWLTQQNAQKASGRPLRQPITTLMSHHTTKLNTTPRSPNKHALHPAPAPHPTPPALSHRRPGGTRRRRHMGRAGTQCPLLVVVRNPLRMPAASRLLTPCAEGLSVVFGGADGAGAGAGGAGDGTGSTGYPAPYARAVGAQVVHTRRRRFY